MTIDSVGSGAEALELLAGGRSYDLAVVDIRLGEELAFEEITPFRTSCRDHVCLCQL